VGALANKKARRITGPFSSSVYLSAEDASGVGPGPEEISLLEPFRGKVPDEVFEDPYAPPVSDGSGQDRALLRKAGALLQKAGFAVKDGKRITPQGEVFMRCARL
jgi:microcin C transport system substrate-binding protein